MNLESERIFIVGPGGAGKSTTGKILSERLKYHYIDVDTVFNLRNIPIPQYVHDYGYVAYCEANSQLVEDLLKENPSKIVMSMPSGFLVHEESPDLVRKHVKLLSQSGISILLLPSESFEETIEIIVNRQLSRGFVDMKEERERAVIARRYPVYKKHGDIKIFSHQSPNEIADLMVLELGKLKLLFK